MTNGDWSRQALYKLRVEKMKIWKKKKTQQIIAYEAWKMQSPFTFISRKDLPDIFHKILFFTWKKVSHMGLSANKWQNFTFPLERNAYERAELRWFHEKVCASFWATTKEWLNGVGTGLTGW